MVFFRPGQRCRWEITKKPHVGELNGATQHPASGLPRPQPDGELQRPDEAEHAVAARLHQPGVAAARRPLERGHRPVLDVEREDEVAVRREVRRAPHHGGRLAAEVDAPRQVDEHLRRRGPPAGARQERRAEQAAAVGDGGVHGGHAERPVGVGVVVVADQRGVASDGVMEMESFMGCRLDEAALAGDGVVDEEVAGESAAAEQDAAAAAVEHRPCVAGVYVGVAAGDTLAAYRRRNGQGEGAGAGADEAGAAGRAADDDGVVEEPRRGGHPAVELAVAAEEGRVAHDAAPLRAHGGGAGERLGKRREAHHDLQMELVGHGGGGGGGERSAQRHGGWRARATAAWMEWIRAEISRRRAAARSEMGN